MGMKTNPGMWCDYCQRPIAGHKATHRFRNIAVGLTAIPSGGLTIPAAKYGEWHCPDCGQPARKLRPTDRPAVATAAPAVAPATVGPPITLAVGVRPDKPSLKWLMGAKATLGPYVGDVGAWAASLPTTIGPVDADTAEQLALWLREGGFPVEIREPAANVPPVTDGPLVDQIAKLTELRASGALTDEEFAAMKAKLIG